MKKVFVKRCSSYDESRLGEIFDSILNATDSIKKLKHGSTVALKTNLLLRKKPEAAATTHPVFIRALAQVLLKRGFKVIVGDSPGGLFTKAALKSVYEECGLVDKLKELNVTLNYDTAVSTVVNPSGAKVKEFTITGYLQNADYIINVPKLKTHVGMTYTGAIKNWYGTIAGERKFDYHVVASEPDDFANMLIDIYLLNKPDLTVMDAVVGMDHNGPAAGKPVAINLVLASEDGFALDLTALKIIGCDPIKVPVMKTAFKRNLCAADGCDIEIDGESIGDVAVDHFVVPAGAQGTPPPFVNSRLFGKLTNLIKPKVAFDYKACIRCEACRKACRANAITFRNSKPVANHAKCIKCFCCHELCTVNAVKIGQSPFLKAMLTLGLCNKRLQKAVDRVFGMLAQVRNRTVPK